MLTRLEFQFPQEPRVENPTDNERKLLAYTSELKKSVAEVLRTLNRPNVLAIGQATLDGTPVGGTTPAAGVFTTLANQAGAIVSGAFSPTATAVANVDSVTPSGFFYSRSGDSVSGFGRLDIDPTANTTTTQVGISLPIASDFAVSNQASGVIVLSSPLAVGRIIADITNNRLQAEFTSANAVSSAYWLLFHYRIL